MHLVVMGVAGSGKTTVGKALATRLGPAWRFADGDDFHPPANLEKMRRGVPLDDADRAPWLDGIRAHLDACTARGTHAVVACSALKRAYRRRLAGPGGDTRFVYLKGAFADLAARLRRRPHHYFKEEMLQSQFDVLEEPAADEALAVGAVLPTEEIVDRIVTELGLPAAW
jgi:gluconokinase